MRYMTSLFTSLFLGNCILAGDGSAGTFDVTPERLQRAVVSYGNNQRLNRFLEKAEQGGNLTVGVLGGSITQGAVCPDSAKCYHGVLLQYLRANFPKSRFTLVNAGIGATGSNYGAFWAQRDLLSKKPDLVVLEYAVNDQDGLQSALTYEGIVRQVLTTPESPRLSCFS